MIDPLQANGLLDLDVIRALLDRHAQTPPVRNFDVGGRLWNFAERRHLVGVINMSTDSWYTESICRTAEEAIVRGEALVREGADAVDIGAESTLPDAEIKDATRQIDTLRPVVEALVAKGILVSVESYHPEVLDALGSSGAQIFNLTGMRHADEALRLAARHQAAVILCYVQGETVREVSDFKLYEDMTPELVRYFTDLTGRAEAAGVSRCFVDPGLGFYYKNLEDGRVRVRHQLDTFLNAFRLAELGYPTFNILPHAPEFFGTEDRRAAEPFFAVPAMLFGTHVIRTHEVRAVARIRDTLAAYQP